MKTVRFKPAMVQGLPCLFTTSSIDATFRDNNHHYLVITDGTGDLQAITSNVPEEKDIFIGTLIVLHGKILQLSDGGYYVHHEKLGD